MVAALGIKYGELPSIVMSKDAATAAEGMHNHIPPRNKRPTLINTKRKDILPFSINLRFVAFMCAYYGVSVTNKSWASMRLV